MDYRKEKNLLIALDGEVIKAKYDWQTGICYGVKGNQLKGISPAFRGSTYGCMITAHRWITSHLEAEKLTLALDRWERLASVGLYTSDYNILFNSDYPFPNLKKDFVEFVKNQCADELSYYAQQKFTYFIMPEYQMLNQENRNVIESILRYGQYGPAVPLDWEIKALLRLQLEDYKYAFSSTSSVDILSKYYSQCQDMGQDKPAITKNFLITICKTGHMHQIWKNEHMNGDLKKYNDLKELYYENDTYIMYPLLTADQFHEEATAQDNCVERLYMERVANGQTHVVVIRKKCAPDKSLVTCEITNHWRINQYLARWNHTPMSPELAFKKELQSYLNTLSQEQGESLTSFSRK